MSVVGQMVLPEVVCTRVGRLTYITPREAPVSDAAALAVREAVELCIERSEIHQIIDLGAVQAVNSRMLELLLDVQDRLMQAGGSLKLANASSLVAEVLYLTRLTEYIRLEDPPEDFEAIAERAAQAGSGRLGDLLVERGLLSEAQVEEAIALQKRRGERLGRIVVEQGWVSEQVVLEFIGGQLSVPVVRLRPGLYDPDVLGLLDKAVALRLRVAPLFKVRDSVFLATADPQNMPALGEVRERLSCTVRPVGARTEDIARIINDNLAGSELTSGVLSDVDEDFELMESLELSDFDTIDEMAAGSPVINLVNSVIQKAVRDGASDVHIEAFRNLSRVRFRIDGVLYEVATQRIELHAALVSRIKVMAGLDISERRLPQDGRLQVYTQGRAVDLRFSSLPGLFGEKVVLRILDKNQAILDVKKLGMTEGNLDTFTGLLRRSHGLILVTGPTGSGKTTSLYAALAHLNSLEKSIVTIEDPVEYQMDVINQNEVRAQIGLSFAKILKHVLRQDPDIVMVGEIREQETAEIAVQAALTGHLVLSTLHTNDAIGAVTRMIDMGVPSYLLSSALIGVVAQRLVRMICPACRTRFVASPDIVERFGWSSDSATRLARGRGCPDCYDSGYSGRMAIHEVLQTSEPLQRLIVSSPSRDELSEFLTEQEVKTLFDDGMRRVLDGLTTIEEVSRMVNC